MAYLSSKSINLASVTSSCLACKVKFQVKTFWWVKSLVTFYLQKYFLVFMLSWIAAYRCIFFPGKEFFVHQAEAYQTDVRLHISEFEFFKVVIMAVKSSPISPKVTPKCNLDVFQKSPKSCKIMCRWLLFENLAPVNFKNSPTWSHCPHLIITLCNWASISKISVF